MDADEIRILILQKLQDGRLPLNQHAQILGRSSDGEVCDACDKPITEPQLIMDGIVSTRGDEKLAQFYVRCFQF